MTPVTTSDDLMRILRACPIYGNHIVYPFAQRELLSPYLRDLVESYGLSSDNLSVLSRIFYALETLSFSECIDSFARILLAFGVTNFAPNELFRSDYAWRHELRNFPIRKKYLLLNFIPLLVRLESLRALLDKPIIITSGYRSPKVNAGVGGAKRSYHLTCRAVDIRVKDMTAEELASWCRFLDFTEVIEYHNPERVHIAL